MDLFYGNFMKRVAGGGGGWKVPTYARKYRGIILFVAITHIERDAWKVFKNQAWENTFWTMPIAYHQLNLYSLLLFPIAFLPTI